MAAAKDASSVADVAALVFAGGAGSLRAAAAETAAARAAADAWTCVEIKQCVGCARQFFTKSFLGDDPAVLARSSGEEPALPRHRAGVASMERAVKF